MIFGKIHNNPSQLVNLSIGLIFYLGFNIISLILPLKMKLLFCFMFYLGFSIVTLIFFSKKKINLLSHVLFRV